MEKRDYIAIGVAVLLLIVMSVQSAYNDTKKQKVIGSLVELSEEQGKLNEQQLEFNKIFTQFILDSQK